MEFIQKLRHYLESTSSSPAALGRLAINDSQVIKDILNRGRQVSGLIQDKILLTMRTNPRGVGRGNYRYTTSETKQDLHRVDRDPCFNCGMRRDLGCRHHPLEDQL